MNWAEFLDDAEPGTVVADVDEAFWTKSLGEWTSPHGDPAWKDARELAESVVRVVALPIATPTADELERHDVHTMFGLTYASWLTLPRVQLQAMPPRWQDRFVRCLDEFQQVVDAASLPVYETRVEVGDWVLVDELTDSQMRRLGITSGEEDDDGLFYDANGNELRSPQRVFVTGGDEPPPYRHHSYPLDDVTASLGIT